MLGEGDARILGVRDSVWVLCDMENEEVRNLVFYENGENPKTAQLLLLQNSEDCRDEIRLKYELPGGGLAWLYWVKRNEVRQESPCYGGTRELSEEVGHDIEPWEVEHMGEICEGDYKIQLVRMAVRRRHVKLGSKKHIGHEWADFHTEIFSFDAQSGLYELKPRYPLTPRTEAALNYAVGYPRIAAYLPRSI